MHAYILTVLLSYLLSYLRSTVYSYVISHDTDTCIAHVAGVRGVDAESGMIEGTACRSIDAGESLGAEMTWSGREKLGRNRNVSEKTAP